MACFYKVVRMFMLQNDREKYFATGGCLYRTLDTGGLLKDCSFYLNCLKPKEKTRRSVAYFLTVFGQLLLFHKFVKI